MNKPTNNTLDRWFKPTVKAINNTSNLGPNVCAKKVIEPNSTKPISASCKLVQRYIHVNDVCRVCEKAKTEEAARCELRCATCFMTVHKVCYNVKGEVSHKDWNCRHCQFIYDEMAWEDVRELDGTAEPKGVTLPTCKPPGNKHKLHQLFTDCNFAGVFMFLQRFRKLGLQLSNVVITLESLADAFMKPKDEQLCAELHIRLLASIYGVIKKVPWYVQLMRFLQEEEYPIAMAENLKFSASSVKAEDLYFELPVTERVAILKFLCEAQFDRNDTLVERIDSEEAESMRNTSIGTDAAGRSYFILEDVATLPRAAVWVCRCAKNGGTEWETVCIDLKSVKSLVQQLSLSVDSADLQLWHVLSRGALKKLTHQQEKKRRTERWTQALAVDIVLDPSEPAKGVGRRSQRNRQQVDYANLDAVGVEEEEVVGNSDESGEEDLIHRETDDDAASGTNEEDGADKGDSRLQQPSCYSSALVKRRVNDHGSTRSSKQIRHSPHENWLP